MTWLARCERMTIAVLGLTFTQLACAAPPDWLIQQVSVTSPAHEDDTDAVLLLSETAVTVIDSTRMKRVERRAYRILRPGGAALGYVGWPSDPDSRVTSLRGWTIPQSGQPFETKDKDVIETSFGDVDGGELVSDLRYRRVLIPAAIPGNVVGYEVTIDERFPRHHLEWSFQEPLPVARARLSLRVPTGWSWKTTWINREPVAPAISSTEGSAWVLDNLPAVPIERRMPPWRGIAGRLVVALQPPTGPGGFQSWHEVGAWYNGLTADRRTTTDAIRAQVRQITASHSDVFARVAALATFVQRDIRYVAIELGIGGYQPHPAAEVFSNRYGDCKDKVTLLSTMLNEIGIASHYVIINTTRGTVGPSTPTNLGFNHVILAIELPELPQAATMPAVVTHARLGRLLFFDPTASLVPIGQLPGALQANYGMLVTPAGGELVQLPVSKPEFNGVQRTTRFTLGETGTLDGEVVEAWSGDAAAEQRYLLRAVDRDVDQIKSVESMLSHSIATFQIKKAFIANLKALDRPFEWRYSLVADRYAKAAGDLLIVRPRVIGSVVSGFLETRKPRAHPIEFDAPRVDRDVVEITLPAGYVVEELPPPVDVDLGFVHYRSSTEYKDRLLRYTRSLELREVSIPVEKADALKRLYRTIGNDERMSAVFRRAAP